MIRIWEDLSCFINLTVLRLWNDDECIGNFPYLEPALFQVIGIYPDICYGWYNNTYITYIWVNNYTNWRLLDFTLIVGIHTLRYSNMVCWKIHHLDPFSWDDFPSELNLKYDFREFPACHVWHVWSGNSHLKRYIYIYIYLMVLIPSKC